jgi:16S rRNA (cytosine967-C5)-methyltransferase
MIAPARWAAFEALRAIHAGVVDAATALARARDRLADERDRALTTELVMGTLRWRGALDHLIIHYARRPLARIDPPVLDVLRIGLYQVLYLTRVPPRAAVDDGVEMVRKAGAPRAAGLTNAVLRAAARGRARPPWPEPPDAMTLETREAALDYLSITLSHPRWLVARWLDRHGFSVAADWARFNNTTAPLTLRVNTLRTTPAAVAAALRGRDVDTRPAAFAPDALIVTRGNPLLTSPAIGHDFAVQDEASQLVAAFVNARPKERILDVCASPGNKTLALAGAMRDAGMLVAADLRQRRVALLCRTIAAGGARSVRIVRLDLSRPLPFCSLFDAVLVDAPCSGLGTIRRDPDIRWRRTAADLSRFADAQSRMLEEAAQVVRPGGRLIYATCSSEPEENDEVVDRFLGRRSEFRLSDPRVDRGGVPSGVEAVLDDRGFLRTRPWAHGLEAFFAAMLVKQKHL